MFPEVPFYQDIEELVENACSALWSLSMEDENIEIMRDENVISMLVAAIKQHINAPKVDFTRWLIDFLSFFIA